MDPIFLSPNEKQNWKTIDLIEAQNDLANMIKKLNEGHGNFRIQNQKGQTAILISEEHYEDLIDMVRILATPDFIANLMRRKTKKRPKKSKK